MDPLGWRGFLHCWCRRNRLGGAREVAGGPVAWALRAALGWVCVLLSVGRA